MISGCRCFLSLFFFLPFFSVLCFGGFTVFADQFLLVDPFPGAATESEFVSIADNTSLMTTRYTVSGRPYCEVVSLPPGSLDPVVEKRLFLPYLDARCGAHDSHGVVTFSNSMDGYFSSPVYGGSLVQMYIGLLDPKITQLRDSGFAIGHGFLSGGAAQRIGFRYNINWFSMEVFSLASDAHSIRGVSTNGDVLLASSHPFDFDADWIDLQSNHHAIPFRGGVTGATADAVNDRGFAVLSLGQAPDSLSLRHIYSYDFSTSRFEEIARAPTHSGFFQSGPNHLTNSGYISGWIGHWDLRKEGILVDPQRNVTIIQDHLINPLPGRVVAEVLASNERGSLLVVKVRSVLYNDVGRIYFAKRVTN